MNNYEEVHALNQQNKYYYGFYRAKVIDNKDTKKFGRVKVYIPDLMLKVGGNTEDNLAIWAYPANNGTGGRNSSGDNHDNGIRHYGTCMIPIKDSWVWVFFENGHPRRPYYFAAIDIAAEYVPPECQLGTEYQDKWCVFRSPNGQCIIVSTDNDDMRTEITGIKREYMDERTSDYKAKESVYPITNNQKTILIDDRDSKDKILIKDNNGNYINIRTHKDHIEIYCNGNLNIKSAGSINIEAESGINMLSNNGDVNIESTNEQFNVKCKKQINMQAMDETDGDITLKSNHAIRLYSENSDEGDVSIKSNKQIHIEAIHDDSGSIDVKCSHDINTESSDGDIHVKAPDTKTVKIGAEYIHLDATNETNVLNSPSIHVSPTGPTGSASATGISGDITDISYTDDQITHGNRDDGSD